MAKTRVGRSVFDCDVATVVADIAGITGETNTIVWPLDGSDTDQEYACVAVDEGIAATLRLEGYLGDADLRVLIPTAELSGDPDEWPKAKQRLKWKLNDKLYQIERVRRALGSAMLLLECSLASRDRE